MSTNVPPPTVVTETPFAPTLLGRMYAHVRRVFSVMDTHAMISTSVVIAEGAATMLAAVIISARMSADATLVTQVMDKHVETSMNVLPVHTIATEMPIVRITPGRIRVRANQVTQAMASHVQMSTNVITDSDECYFAMSMHGAITLLDLTRVHAILVTRVTAEPVPM
jgi:hypothetical protein